MHHTAALFPAAFILCSARIRCASSTGSSTGSGTAFFARPNSVVVRLSSPPILRSAKGPLWRCAALASVFAKGPIALAGDDTPSMAHGDAEDESLADAHISVWWQGEDAQHPTRLCGNSFTIRCQYLDWTHCVAWGFVQSLWVAGDYPETACTWVMPIWVMCLSPSHVPVRWEAHGVGRHADNLHTSIHCIPVVYGAWVEGRCFAQAAGGVLLELATVTTHLCGQRGEYVSAAALCIIAHVSCRPTPSLGCFHLLPWPAHCVPLQLVFSAPQPLATTV